MQLSRARLRRALPRGQRALVAAPAVVLMLAVGALVNLSAEPATTPGTATIFAPGVGPTSADAAQPDGAGVELGIRFTAAVAGVVTGVRFYKGPGNDGTHYVHLWTSAGLQLAQARSSAESDEGWQSVTFDHPVRLSPDSSYIASYYAPLGHYAATARGFARTLGRGPLQAQSTGNGLYAYTTQAGGTFPTQSLNDNYWVDVLFTPAATSARTPLLAALSPTPTAGAADRPGSLWSAGQRPRSGAQADGRSADVGVRFDSSTPGYITGLRFYKAAGNTGVHIASLFTATGSLLARATFISETDTGWQDVRFTNPVRIAAHTTYVASYYAPHGHYSTDVGGLSAQVRTPPLRALAGADGGNGVYAYASAPTFPSSSYLSTNYWVDVDFTTSPPQPRAQPAARPGVRGAGPILVLTDPTDAFSGHYCSSILSAEGLQACAETDTGNLAAALPLDGFRVIVLADRSALPAAQLLRLTSWVEAGGTLVAVRPPDDLGPLLGLGATIGTASDGYYTVDTTRQPGSGIAGLPLQYHGEADLRPLQGARAVAWLGSGTATRSGYPAVSSRHVGAGTALAFSFDVARSITYTREGNPALAGQVTASLDGLPRIADRFGDGWLDVSRAAVPQADELERLLVNMIEPAVAMPRLWYLPSYQPKFHPGGLLPAAFVLTGDDHATDSRTVQRFSAEAAASPPDCDPAAWTCITSTSYAYPGAFPGAAALPFIDRGFEVAPHPSEGSSDGGDSCLRHWSTVAEANALFTDSLLEWHAAYPGISARPPLTVRQHCYGIWHDYAGLAQVEADAGFRADVNSACWPPTLFTGAQCLFTGTGLPERFSRANGTQLDVYQLTTVADDENPVTVTPEALDTLARNAVGPNGYYGIFTVMAHLDNLDISRRTEQATLQTAARYHLPVVSAAQATRFWLGRAATKVGVGYRSDAVTFTITDPVPQLELMQPTRYGARTLTGITRDGSAVRYSVQVINGISYALVPAAAAGSYVAAYS